MISKALFIGIGLVIGLVVGLSVGFFVTSSELESNSQELDMQLLKQMMLDDSSKIQETILSTMQDSDQIQMMEHMMSDMMQRMQNDPELEQAMMVHMERMKSSTDTMLGNMDNSVIDDIMDIETNFPSSELQQKKSYPENEFGSCTSDWYVTGYFLPIESDYSGKSVEISVDRVKQFYLVDFLEDVKIEGWGKTNAGNYLGWYHGDFTMSDTYLDAHGNDLVVGMVAVDGMLIEHGTELTIPTLPEPWDVMVFSGLDEGPSIIGKHIDVFTGEGINAENETFRITSSNNKVCMQNKLP